MVRPQRGGGHPLLLLLLVMTVQICAVAAEEPAEASGFGGESDALIEMLQILPEEDPPKPLESALNNIANPTPPVSTEDQIREHAAAIANAEKTLSASGKTMEESTAKVKENEKQTAELLAQYKHTDDAAEAKQIKDKIDELKKSAAAETQKINKAEEDIAWHEGKKHFHDEELKKLNIIPPANAADIAKKVKAKMEAKQKTETEALTDHVQFNAIQAKNLAFQNKMLLDRIGAHTSAVAVEKKKTELNDNLVTLNSDHSAALQEVAAASDTEVKEQAQAKADGIAEHIKQVQAEIKGLDPANEDEDPLMALTPGARTKVLALREKITLQKGMMEDKVAKFEEDLKNTQDKVAELEDTLGKEEDEEERQKIDRELTEWKTSEVDMKKAHEEAIAGEQASLTKMEQDESAMLIGNPMAAKKKGPELSEELNKMEESVKKSKAAAQSVTFAVGYEESAAHEDAVAKATVLELTEQRNTLEKDIANELSDAKAKELQAQLDELNVNLKAAQDRAEAAAKKFEERKLEASQKKQYMVLTDENARQEANKLETEKDELNDPVEFDDVKVSVDEMLKALDSSEAIAKDTLEAYDKKVEDAQAKAEAASGKVADAITAAEKTAEEVTKVKEDMAGEEEPEIIKQLQAKLEAAIKAEETARLKVEHEKKVQQDQMKAVLTMDNEALDRRKNELQSTLTDLKKSREQLATKQQVAQEKMQAAAKDKDNEEGTKEAYEAAQKSVEEVQAHILQLEAQRKVAEEAVKMMTIEDDEKQEKEKEVAAEAEVQAEEQTADGAQASLVEVKAEYTRVKSSNKELTQKVKEFKKSSGIPEAEVQKRMKTYEEKLKEDSEAAEAKIERDHETEREKSAVAREERINTIIAQETKDLTAMKIRMRKLDAITKRIKDDAGTKQSLESNMKEEEVEEDHLVSTLKFHVKEETEAKNNAVKYQNLLKAAVARHTAALQVQKDRAQAEEEIKMKAEAKRTMEQREQRAKEEREKAKTVDLAIHDAQFKVKELEANNATVKEITEAEGKLSELTDKREKMITDAKVDAMRAEKSQVDALKITALEPVRAAKAAHQALQLRIDETSKRRKDFESKLVSLKKQKVALAKQMISVINVPDEKLKLESKVAKNNGLIEATEELLKSAKEAAKKAWDAGTAKVEEIQRLENKRDDILMQAPLAVRSKVLEDKLAKEKAKAEADAAKAAKKAKEDAASVTAAPKPEEENQEIAKRVSQIVASAKKVADASALPVPPPTPEPSNWVWDGAEPKNGKPPIPLVDPTKELEAAAKQSKANLSAKKKEAAEDSKNAAVAVAAQKADADQAADGAKAANLEKKIKAKTEDAGKQDAVDTAEKDAAAKTAVDAKDAVKKDAPSLLDYATEFLQKWVWNGPEPKEGTPPIPKYMKVAAQDMSDEKPKPKLPPPPPAPAFGPVEVAQDTEDEAKANVETAKKEAQAAKAIVDDLKKQKTGAAGVEDAAKIEKQITEAIKAQEKAKSKLELAKQAMENDKMALAEAKVGEGKEDAGEAIEQVKEEKEAMARSKLASAKQKVDKAEAEKEEASAKRAEVMQTEDKMKQIEKTSKSPAVKAAAEQMEEKEEKQGLEDLEDNIQAAKEKKIAKQKQEKEQAEEEKEMLKDEEGASDAEKEVEQAKASAKKVMDFEGLSYEKNTKNSAAAQISAAKKNALWHKMDRRAKVTTSSEQKKILKEKVSRLKAAEGEDLLRSQQLTEAANMATLNQHETARQLDKTLKAAVAAAIANAAEPQTDKQAKAKEAEEVNQQEADAEGKELEVSTEAVAQLKKRISDLQSKRLDDERERKNVKEQEAAVKKNPMPELPKGVKAPKAIERAKEQKLEKKDKKLKSEEKETANQEVRATVELEKVQDKVDLQKKKAAVLSEKADMAKRQVQKAEDEATNAKYGAQSVLKKSKADAALSAADKVLSKVRLETEAKLDAPAESVEEAAIDNKISKEKSAVSDIQEKLSALRTKISTPVLESVQGAGSPGAVIKAEAKAETQTSAASTAEKTELKAEVQQVAQAKQEVKQEAKQEQQSTQQEVKQEITAEKKEVAKAEAIEAKAEKAEKAAVQAENPAAAKQEVKQEVKQEAKKEAKPPTSR